MRAKRMNLHFYDEKRATGKQPLQFIWFRVCERFPCQHSSRVNKWNRTNIRPVFYFPVINV